MDASTLSAFFGGEPGKDIELLAGRLARGDVGLPPVVVTELLSDPTTARLLAPKLADLELLGLSDGYWQRAGETRATLRARGLKAKVADALIAQSCIDHEIALITRDPDFRHFAKVCGLKLG